MANVAHSTLTGSNLHENKGVAAATDNYVATATSGATVWKKLDNTNLGVLANPFGSNLLHVRDERSSGTVGGTLAVTTWQTITLQTTKTNEISGASLASNQITLPAGTYFAEGIASAFQGQECRSRLQNVSDGTTSLYSLNVRSGTNLGYDGADTGLPFFRGRFTIASQKVFELQVWSSGNSSGTQGLGRPTSVGINEVYAEVLIWKIA